MKNKFRLGEGVEHGCRYCLYSAEADGESCFCSKKGIVDADGKCRKYEYNPLKREPAPRRQLDEHSADEFSL